MNGRPAVRRWSSQTIAGRSGLPGLVGHDDRAALGRDRQPGDRVAPDGRVGQDPPAGVAERPPVQLGVLLGPAGLGRDVRLDRDACARDEDARGIEHERPDALRPDVDGEDLLGHGGPVLEEDARAPSVRPGRRSGRAPRWRPSRARPSRPARYGAWSVPTPCWWLIVAPWLDDDLAGRGLERAPAVERLVGIGREPEDVGRVQARAARVAVRQVAEGVDALADGFEPVSERAPELGGQVGEGRPVGRGLERVDRVAGVPQRVAQVRCREPAVPPGRIRCRVRRCPATRGRGRRRPWRPPRRRPGCRSGRRSRGSAPDPSRGRRGSAGGAPSPGRRRRARTSSPSRAASRRGPSTAAGPTARAVARAAAHGPSPGRGSR